MPLTDVFQISADNAKPCIFTCRTGIRLQTDACKACDDFQFFTEIVYQFTVALCLVLGNKRMHAHEFRTTEGQHFRRSVQLHGAGTQGNHGVGKGNILAIEAFDITHHFRFCVIFIEHFMGQIRTLTFQSLADSTVYGNIFCFCPILTGGNGKNGEQDVGSRYICCFIDTHTYISIVEIAQVNFFTQGNGTYLLCRYSIRQCKT